MKNIILYTILLLSISLYAQDVTSLVVVKNHTIDSKFLESTRSYWVSLPSDYDSTETYPVIYVLDAELKFNIVNALEKELSSNGKIPAHIIVGLIDPNRRLNMTFSTSKVNCYGEKDTYSFTAQNSGNGLQLLGFIEEELIEEINLMYSTSGFNILIGHSLGGYFCSYILPIQKSFKSLQIYDPSIWYSEGEVIQHIDTNLSEESHAIIFISSSGNFDNQFAYHHKKIKKLNKTLNHFPNIHNQYKTYKEEDHNSMYLHSFLDGILSLYNGYEMDMRGLETDVSVSKVEEHFNQFSQKVQFGFTPPISVYLSIGKANFFQKKYQNCIDALNIYLVKNPNDSYALQVVGDAYVNLGDKEQGLMYYSKAYELSTENIRLKKKIENLKK